MTSTFLDAVRSRVVIYDGATGTWLREQGLTADDFGGAAFEKLYSKIDIVPVYPSGIEYDYTFRRAVDPTLAAPELDRQGSTLRAQSRAVVIPEMEKFGFVDATVTFTYRNPDGSVVWTRTFS